MSTFEDVLAREVEGPIAGYIVAAAYLDENGETMLYLNNAYDQPVHISMGLIEFAKTYLTKKFMNDFDV